MSSFPDLALGPDLVHRWDTALADDDISYAADYPGLPGPGPVHTVYVPVSRFDAAAVQRWRADALRTVEAHSDEWTEVLSGIAAATGGQDPDVLHHLAIDKLDREPIEDLRIDMEDGFRPHRGVQDDADEDAQAVRAAGELARMGDRPASTGIRIRGMGATTRHRALRTLDLFLAHLVGGVPDGFLITLPKVTSTVQVAVFAEALAVLESRHGALRFEIQVETPQTLLAADGRIPLPAMIRVGGGRVTGLHFGTYDYSASMGVLGPYQDLRHPVADTARSLMLLAAAETGVRVSDGSDNRLPIGEASTVRERWARHADGVLRALRGGIYQGWDLHPAQLPSRFAATFAFYRDGFTDAAERLRRYDEQLAGGVMDEPATAFALARHLAAARSCGAVSGDELAPLTDAVLQRHLIRGTTAHHATGRLS